MDSRDIEELEPETRKLCRELIRKSEESGIPIIITSTFRDWDTQDRLFSKGRTTPGRKVTNARGGYSWHNFRRAFDFVPLDAHGGADWNDLDKFDKVGAIGKSLGLEWGGDFKTFPDRPHFQFTHGMSLAQARDLYGKM